MPGINEEEGLDAPQNVGVYLEIERSEGKPMEFPVTVRNFTRDLVTLEVEGSWGGEVGPDLVGRCCSLHLAPAGSERSLDLRGSVTWTRDAGDEEEHFTLGLKLIQPPRLAERLLEDRLPPRPRDIQGLWERWDQARAAPITMEDGLSSLEHFLAGLGLLVGGLTLQLQGGKAMKTFGDAWCLYGFAVMAGTALWCWWRRRRN